MAKITRKTWHQWHRMAGLNLALLIGFVLFTGTLAVMSHELDYLFNPAVRAHTPAINIADEFDWTQAYKAVLAEAGDNQIASLSLPLHQGFNAEAILRNNEGIRYRVYVHPGSYHIAGEGRWYNWRTTLRQLHRHLMLPLWLGLAIVSSLSFLMIISLVSGLCLYPHWWKGLWQLPRRRNPRLFWADFHRFTGLWSVWLLVIIAVTGIWYFLEQHGLKANFPAQQQIKSETSNPPEVSVAVLESALATTQALRPKLRVKTIFLPQEPGDPLRIDGQEGNVLVRDRASNLLFDPLSGNLIDQRFGENLNLHVRISEAADPLHFGNWGGYWSKIPYFLFGCVLTSLTITGIYLTALREVKLKRGESRISQRQLFKLGIFRMGKLTYPASGLIMVSLVLTAFSLATYPVT